MTRAHVGFFSGLRRFASLCTAMAVFTAVSRGQETVVDGPASPPSVPTSSVFTLNPASSLQLAPRGSVSTLGRGTFELMPGPNAVSDRTVLRHFTVSAVNMLFTIDNAEYYVTGTGSYDIVRGASGMVPLAQRMTLDLRVGDTGIVRRFTSGNVPLLGATINLAQINIALRSASTTATDGMTLRIGSALVRPESITPYAVDARTSEFLRGCYDPCDCVLVQTPCGGSFGLLALPRSSTNAAPEYALVHMRFDVLGSSVNTASLWAGAGILQLDRCPLMSPLGSEHLRADLKERGAATDTRFDTDCVVRTVRMPMIHAAMADHGFVCFNQVFDFTASPRN